VVLFLLLLLFDFNLHGSLLLSLRVVLLAFDDGSLGLLGVVLVGSPVASSAPALLDLFAAASSRAAIVLTLAIASRRTRSAASLGVAVVVSVASLAAILLGGSILGGSCLLRGSCLLGVSFVTGVVERSKEV
jgi:hypothetical protein